MRDTGVLVGPGFTHPASKPAVPHGSSAPPYSPPVSNPRPRNRDRNRAIWSTAGESAWTACRAQRSWLPRWGVGVVFGILIGSLTGCSSRAFGRWIKQLITYVNPRRFRWLFTVRIGSVAHRPRGENPVCASIEWSRRRPTSTIARFGDWGKIVPGGCCSALQHGARQRPRRGAPSTPVSIPPLRSDPHDTVIGWTNASEDPDRHIRQPLAGKMGIQRSGSLPWGVLAHPVRKAPVNRHPLTPGFGSQAPKTEATASRMRVSMQRIRSGSVTLFCPPSST